MKLILLNVGSAVNDGNWNWPGISSPFFRIYLVAAGSARLGLLGKEYVLSPGHLYLVPPFALHSDHCDGHFEHCYLHVYEEMGHEESLFEQWAFPVEIKADLLDEMLFRRLLQINPNKGLDYFDPQTYDNSRNLFKSIAESTREPLPVLMETEGLIQILLSRFLANSVKSIQTEDARILKALSYIRKHIDRKISVSELASICLLSEYHFLRLFKRELKTSPINYINQKKIERAQLLLVVYKRSIKEIAYSLSFENVSYFTRLFRNVVGKTPSSYREEFLEK
ncbi:MAG: AraC family transcriptional regulator [Bacteroidia bacterium]|nr:AraC family transcriptional regulator [Bacteroidia bacterium]